MALSKEFLEILACPKCKREICITEDEKWLLCKHCKLKYPIREGIPVMLVEETEPIE